MDLLWQELTDNHASLHPPTANGFKIVRTSWVKLFGSAVSIGTSITFLNSAASGRRARAAELSGNVGYTFHFGDAVTFYWSPWRPMRKP